MYSFAFSKNNNNIQSCINLKVCTKPYAFVIVSLTNRFADFVEGLSHLRPNEVAVHAQEYGFGGSFMEEEFFDSDEEEQEEEEHQEVKTFSRRH